MLDETIVNQIDLVDQLNAGSQEKLTQVKAAAELYKMQDATAKMEADIRQADKKLELEEKALDIEQQKVQNESRKIDIEERKVDLDEKRNELEVERVKEIRKSSWRQTIVDGLKVVATIGTFIGACWFNKQLTERKIEVEAEGIPGNNIFRDTERCRLFK